MKKILILLAVLTALAVGCSGNDGPVTKAETKPNHQVRVTDGSYQNITADVLIGNKAPIVTLVISSGVVATFPTPTPGDTQNYKVCEADVGTVLAGVMPIGKTRVLCGVDSPSPTIKYPVTPAPVGTTITGGLGPFDVSQTGGIQTYAILPVAFNSGAQARAAAAPVPTGFAEPIPVDLAAYQQAIN